MASHRDGARTILEAARLICRMERQYGVAGITALIGADSPGFVAAVTALSVACRIFDAADAPGRAGVIDADDPD